MQILFTGASSFTGFWFVHELVAAGHEVFTIFTRASADKYDGVRKKRVEIIGNKTKAIFSCRFGDESFLSLIKKESHWDLLCHHAADVTDYKSKAFNVTDALGNNTKNMLCVLDNLVAKGIRGLIYTGSIFENGEGLGSDNLRAFSPYGLSKSLSFEIIKYYSSLYGVKLGKFVIPNPFGPLEEFRFTSYLAKTWLEGRKAEVNTPLYVRDNIHIDLLAKSYVHITNTLLNSNSQLVKLNPSGYPESMGAFTRRFSDELSKRLSLPCEFELKRQTDFSEPLVRINSDVVSPIINDWVEEEAWDNLSNYYLKILGSHGILN